MAIDPVTLQRSQHSFFSCAESSSIGCYIYAALTLPLKPKGKIGTCSSAQALILIENQLTKLTGNRSKGLFVGKAQ